ncbi:MAG: putative integral rane protein [Actinoallomurus sp.]|nr:putative integral rane protein [Actinoallomurus sp.]
MTATLQPARPADAIRTRSVRHQRWLFHPVVAATAVAGILHLLWALFLGDGGGDLAAQSAWAEFALRHPSSAYDLAWYGGMHPASYSIISPYLMALLGVRTTGVIAGTLSAALLAVLLMRSGIGRPLAPALWGAFSLSCNAVSGRVTFALGVLFGLAALTVVFSTRGPRAPRAVAVLALGVLATLASPVAGLFLEVAAAALFLTRRRRPAYALAAGPPFVVAISSLLFPFSGVQPFPWFLVAAPVASAVALAFYAPKSWRSVRAGAVVYAAGTILTWIIPSQVGSNVDRLALLFGGAMLLAAAMERKIVILYAAFAATVISQVARPVFDVVTTGSSGSRAGAVIAELRQVRADQGRVEVVPERTHLEASEFAPQVNLARGWNRQADVNRNPLFYDGSLTPDTYHAWLRRWAVRYVVLSDAPPDWEGIREAQIVSNGQPWLRQVWHDRHWRLYRVADPDPLADPPATVDRADDGELDITVPAGGWVLIRVPWSPWLGVLGGSPGCVARAGDWTRLYTPAPGRYRLGGTYQLPRGTPC